MLIYFAAPLFSAAERAFNAEATNALESAGLHVFLPQRDGAEADREPWASMSRDRRRQAMFDLDVSRIRAADVFLLVSDGRVPDEGASFELGVAWMARETAGRPSRLVGLHTDSRRAFKHALLNPMLAVPLEEVHDSVPSLVDSLQRHTTR